MPLLSIVLTEYTSEDEAVLRLWWENETVLSYLGSLDQQLDEVDPGTQRSPGQRIARPILRWMAREAHTGTPLGYVAVAVLYQSGLDEPSPVRPPFYGGVNIVVDPGRRRRGIGTATLAALYEHLSLADVETLGGWVDSVNTRSVEMLRKLDVPVVSTDDDRRDRKTFYHFTILGPAARQR